MFNWLIKLLGGYTKEQYLKQYKIAYNSQLEINSIFTKLSYEIELEELIREFVQLYTVYEHSPVKCLDLAYHYAIPIKERIK